MWTLIVNPEPAREMAVADEPSNVAEGPSGTQSVERAIALLRHLGRHGAAGARLTDLVAGSGLNKATVRRLLAAMIREGMIEQDPESRLYFLGAETFVLGTIASARFGLLKLAQGALMRLTAATEDVAFLSVPRGTEAVCVHREEGSFPIRTYVLKAGDRHPLGVGAGSVAM